MTATTMPGQPDPGPVGGLKSDVPRWIAVGDADGAVGKHPDPLPACTGLIAAGSVVAEFLLAPGHQAGPLFAFNSHAGWRRQFSITMDPCGTIWISQQQGMSHAELALRLTLPDQRSLVRLTFSWDAPGRISRLTAETPHDGGIQQALGTNPLPMPVEDALAMASDRSLALRHPGLIWFGITSGVKPVGLPSGSSANTLVRTPLGPRRLHSLRPGDLVTTRDAGPMPVLWVGRSELPALGSYRPIRLSAPYFGNQSDLILAPDQRIALRGAEVEYLFGEDEMLVAARSLVDGRVAVYERDRERVRYHTLLLENHALLETDGCLQESLFIGNLAQSPDLHSGSALADMPFDRLPNHRLQVRPELRGFEAATLLAMRDQSRNPVAA